MSNIGEIMEFAQSYSDSQQHTSEARNIARAELRHLIAAALADARREGAEQMRAAVESALDDLPLPDGFFVSDIMGAINDALPLPTGERQAVLLTDEQIERAVDGHGWTVSELQVEDIPGMARDIEAAVLAANNLGVRRG